MKFAILSIFTSLVFSTQSQATVLSDFLNDDALDAIVCSDLNYDHDSQNYKLSLSVDIENGQAVGAELKQNNGAVKLTATPIEASSDLKAISFGDYTLELSEKQFLNSSSYWGVLKQSDVAVADVVCGFVFVSTGE